MLTERISWVNSGVCYLRGHPRASTVWDYPSHRSVYISHHLYLLTLYWSKLINAIPCTAENHKIINIDNLIRFQLIVVIQKISRTIPQKVFRKFGIFLLQQFSIISILAQFGLTRRKFTAPIYLICKWMIWSQ